MFQKRVLVLCVFFDGSLGFTRFLRALKTRFIEKTAQYFRKGGVALIFVPFSCVFGALKARNVSGFTLKPGPLANAEKY